MNYFAQLFCFLITLFSLLCFASCNQIEGCSDPLASNYNAEADKNCCCNYYQLYVNLEHRIDTQNLNYFTPYLDANNDTFEIQEAAFLWSNFKMGTPSGRWATVQDSITIGMSSGMTKQLVNDFISIQPNVFVRNIGGFIDYDTYEKVQFLIGLDEYAASADANNLIEETNPLSSQHKPMFFNGTAYNSAFFEIITRATMDTIRLEIQDTFWITLDYHITTQDGQNTRIPLAIDYLKIFNGVSFINDDSTTIVQKIKTNIKNGISIQ